jgi:hypothetical protein
LSTIELALRVRDRVDHDAVTQIRRAIDALAHRGLVTTWTDSFNGDRWVADEAENRLFLRRFMAPSDWVGTRCDGGCCYWCTTVGSPTATDAEGRPLHLGAEVVAKKSRMRWVEYAWTARSPAERVALLDRWIDEERAGLARFGGRRPDGDDLTAALGTLMFDRLTAAVDRHQLERRDLLETS